MSTTTAPLTFPILSAAIATIPGGGNVGGSEYDEAKEAYGSELLPLVLGGKWKPSTTFPYDLLSIRTRMDLLDHHLSFRRINTRGPATLSNTAFIGQPYNAMSRDGKVSAGAMDEAAVLRNRGVAVWLRQDLSAWYPGWTQLTLLTRDLSYCSPAKYGFVSI